MTSQERLRAELEAEARDVADWLEAHGRDFPPIRVVRVSAKVITTDEGDPAVDLDAVLEDPADPRVGWPGGALFDMIDAVNAYARTTEHGMFVYLFPVAVSGLAA